MIVFLLMRINMSEKSAATYIRAANGSFSTCMKTLCLCLAIIPLLWPIGVSAQDTSVNPSQVLVLYNADWEDSGPFLSGMQGSRAVAEHYVRMHADPVSGEKPYMLGLVGKRFLTRLLDGDDLEEKSDDNECGVIYRSSESGRTVSACEMRDSRLVEAVLPEAGAPWNTATLRLGLESVSRPDRPSAVLVENGRSLYPALVKVQPDGKWNVRAIGRTFMSGEFTARIECADARGEVHTWSAQYHDIERVEFSPTGPDGLRDDQNYLDCVENPVRKFLEDPANARPDGSLLKDHVLYIVVCYGLPHTVAAPYGIATGITEHLRDFGSRIDLGQRLQLMYYDCANLHRDQVRPLPLAGRMEPGREAFRDYVFRASIAAPLLGAQFNPFMHPGAYRNEKGASGVDPPRFTPDRRAARPDRHLFFSMRIDGTTPAEAMELVDRAVYASRHAGPAMGVLAGASMAGNGAPAGREYHGSPALPLRSAGYSRLLEHPRGWLRLELFWLPPDAGFLNSGPVFLPGGIAALVQSNQGWNVPDSRFREYLRQGVTVTAGSARVTAGMTPHIHNRSFWDEGLFYPYLLKGYPTGEILLANQVHLNWITTFVGDPLYRLPLEPRQPPELDGLSWERSVRVAAVRDPELGKGFLVMADLGATASEPRVAQMRLSPVSGEAQEGQAHVFGRFSSRPQVFVPAGEAQASALWRMELAEPFGERVTLEGPLMEMLESQ